LTCAFEKEAWVEFNFFMRFVFCNGNEQEFSTVARNKENNPEEEINRREMHDW
jgi:hypothetical protein